MLDVLDTIEQWIQAGRPTALATVVSTWGSAPRQAGAKMGVTADMGMIGSVSGGCVETAVASAAMNALDDGQQRLLDFGVSDDTAWSVGLACGGKISVYVEPLDRGWWQVAADHARTDRALATATVLHGPQAGQKLAVDYHGVVFGSAGLSDAQQEALASAARVVLERKQPERVQAADLDVFVELHRPRPRLIIVGGAHTAMALTQLANLLGYRVVLIDPRQAFASLERFPNVELIAHEYPEEVLPQIGLTEESYIAVLTHDPKIDDGALQVALPSRVPYVGVLSSRRTHQKRVERLTEAGMAPELLARIRTPIGLEIGAKTPEEIALAIMAEIVAVRNGVLQ
ncbi:MAG: XdhC family protein [Chloroflexaceae bacterium]|nr:XdhC family protein [Chloroflexaceae bacterium]